MTKSLYARAGALLLTMAFAVAQTGRTIRSTSPTPARAQWTLNTRFTCALGFGEFRRWSAGGRTISRLEDRDRYIQKRAHGSRVCEHRLRPHGKMGCPIPAAIRFFSGDVQQQAADTGSDQSGTGENRQDQTDVQ